MTDAAKLTLSNTSDLAGANATKGRCPHLLFRNVLGPDLVRAMFEYACARERDFIPALVKNRSTERQRIDSAVRDCYRLDDLGDFRDSIVKILDPISVTVVQQLGLSERAIQLKELEISCYADGGHFSLHIDTGANLSHVRILSCVYYFAPTPLRFSGGVLRLHALPALSTRHGLEPQTIDIMPETDTLVIFPSWLWHEVLKVEVPSGIWADGRFAVNCWFNRVS
jgi:Rps23 Pro-64 3,4-dihydroxylase Tpa1-like proline 4-hydroxylase